MKNVSSSTLYVLIESGVFKARKVSERKRLVLVTYYCVTHDRKAVDDIDTWLNDLAA